MSRFEVKAGLAPGSVHHQVTITPKLHEGVLIHATCAFVAFDREPDTYRSPTEVHTADVLFKPPRKLEPLHFTSLR